MIGLALMAGWIALNVGAIVAVWIVNGRPATGLRKESESRADR